MKTNTNRAIIAGYIEDKPTEYECCGEIFYSFTLASARSSGIIDKIPVNISKYLAKDLSIGVKVCMTGQIRTYNKQMDGKNRLIIVFFGQEVKEYSQDLNQVDLSGYLCKEPVFRVTPLGRSICDALLAVNRERGKSDYIPCIIWGRTARHISELKVGSQVAVNGRFQSRIYNKKVDNATETVEYTAYEISINRIIEASDEVQQ